MLFKHLSFFLGQLSSPGLSSYFSPYRNLCLLMTMSEPKPRVLLLGDIDQYVQLTHTHTPHPSPMYHVSRTSSCSHNVGSSPLTIECANSAPARSAYDSLSSLAHFITPKSTNPADFLQECQSGAFNGTKAIYRTFGSVSITGRIEGEVVKTLAESGVRFIAHNGAGYDQYVRSTVSTQFTRKKNNNIHEPLNQ